MCKAISLTGSGYPERKELKELSKDLNMTVLFDFYRNILTEKQAEAIDLYYNEDLSLAEISEHLGITRQGVRDSIKKSENTMLEMEAGLRLAERHTALRGIVSQVILEIEKLDCKPERLEKIRELLEEVYNGI